MAGKRKHAEDKKATSRHMDRDAEKSTGTFQGEWEETVPKVLDILDSRLKLSANVSRRADILRAAQRSVGSAAIQRLVQSASQEDHRAGVTTPAEDMQMQKLRSEKQSSVIERIPVASPWSAASVSSGIPVVQLKLPAITEPTKITTTPKFDKKTKTALKEYLKNTRQIAYGQQVVTAAAAWLSVHSNVQFTGQADIEKKQPEFHDAPTGEAVEAGEADGRDLYSEQMLAGFTYMYKSKDGKMRYKVEIYPYALHGESDQERLGNLTGYIGHEYIHILQGRVGGTHTHEEREFQAWLWQAEQAAQLGVRPRGPVATDQILSHLNYFYGKLSSKDKTKAIKKRVQDAQKSLRTLKKGGGP